MAQAAREALAAQQAALEEQAEFFRSEIAEQRREVQRFEAEAEEAKASEESTVASARSLSATSSLRFLSVLPRLEDAFAGIEWGELHDPEDMLARIEQVCEWLAEPHLSPEPSHASNCRLLARRPATTCASPPRCVCGLWRFGEAAMSDCSVWHMDFLCRPISDRAALNEHPKPCSSCGMPLVGVDAPEWCQLPEEHKEWGPLTNDEQNVFVLIVRRLFDLFFLDQGKKPWVWPVPGGPLTRFEADRPFLSSVGVGAAPDAGSSDFQMVGCSYILDGGDSRPTGSTQFRGVRDRRLGIHLGSRWFVS